MSTKTRKQLKEIKSEDFSAWATSFWLIKKRTSAESPYSALRVDMDRKLQNRFRRYLKQQLQGKVFHLAEYDYNNADGDDALFTIDADATDFTKVAAEIGKGFSNQRVTSHEELLRSWAYVILFENDDRKLYAWKKISADTQPKKAASKDLAFFMQGEPLFDDYVEAVSWAQDYARENREAMMARVLHELRHRLPKFQLEKMAVNCHHNYVQKETHGDVDLLVTRKGAVSARAGELGIIPGSMGAKSFIVRGLGNADSFHSCSHGAGRVMSRTAARQQITLAQHREATAHVECRKDAGVIDESPAAYKDIDAVMAAQSDLVEIVHTLRQVLCVKG